MYEVDEDGSYIAEAKMTEEGGVCEGWEMGGLLGGVQGTRRSRDRGSEVSGGEVR